MSRLQNICLMVICLGMMTGIVHAVVPIANFSASPTSGDAPLDVVFSDLSTGSPTGWAWFFGDENYTNPWIQMKGNTNGTVDTSRESPGCVVMADDSIVLMGGVYWKGFDPEERNDTWRSTDKGASWTLLNRSSGWPGWGGHNCIVTSDDTIVLIGSNGNNDTWQSDDKGASWTLLNASCGWSPRAGKSCVVTPDDTIVLMGGGIHNDTWQSIDKGASWTQVNSSSGWSARSDHSSVVLPDGSILLMGGSDPTGGKNDTWISTDKGVTWIKQTERAEWSERANHCCVGMPDGSIVLIGGREVDDSTMSGYKSDVWRSTDKGVTWTEINANSWWETRYLQTCVTLSDGTIVLIGGMLFGNIYDGPWFSSDYGKTWQPADPYEGWSRRLWYNSVALYDGSIVLLGGLSSGHMMMGLQNDTWRSIDKGVSWTLLNGSAGWSQRSNHASVTPGDGSIVLMGGYDVDGYKNDVWRSPDHGATWDLINANPGWPARSGLSSVAMHDGSILLTGGACYTDHYTWYNDTWRSTDNGASWIRMTANAPWSARASHTTVAMPDGSVVLMGGWNTALLNDVWRSEDNGSTWDLVNASAEWPARGSHTCVALPDGSILLMGGMGGNDQYFTDIWRSTDNGLTWNEITSNTVWEPRKSSNSLAMPDGSVLLVGGGNESYFFNDVWRFTPAGSTDANPSHTYTKRGIYNVALQVYNAEGFNSVRKNRYITIQPISIRSINPTSGYPNTTVSIAITGINFQPGMVVNFSNNTYPLRNLTLSISSFKKDRVTGNLTIPLDAPCGKWDLVLTNPGNQPFKKIGAFTVLPWQKSMITTIIPNSEYQNRTMPFTLNGKYFESGAIVNFTKSGYPAGNLTANLSSVTLTKITGNLTFPAGVPTGKWDIVVTTPDGGQGIIKSGIFTVNHWPKPVAYSINQTSSYRNTTFQFTLNGKYYQNGTTVNFTNSTYPAGNLTATITSLTPTKIKGIVTIPYDVPTGKWNVVIFTPEGGEGIPKNVIVTIKGWPKPVALSVLPSSGYRNTTISFTLNGNYFQDNSVVSFSNSTYSGGNLSANISSVTMRKIKGEFKIPYDAPAGKWNVMVTSPDGGLGLPKIGALTVKPWPNPAIFKFSPYQGIHAVSTLFTINGNFFQPGSTVVLTNSTNPAMNMTTTVTSVTQTKIIGNVDIPADRIGKFGVEVHCPDGLVATKMNSFTVT